MGCFALMLGLMSKEEHLAFSCNAESRKPLLTFGLNEENILLRNFDFINKETVIANFDNDRSKWNVKGALGIVTYPPERILEFVDRFDAEVVIMSGHVGEIALQLDSSGVRKYYGAIFMGPEQSEERLGGFFKGNKALIEANEDKIKEVRSLLKDEKSIEVFDGVLRLRQTSDAWTRMAISGDLYTPDMYFPNDIQSFVLGPNESFVDAGACLGDTVEKFLRKVNYQYAKIYAFEPDPSNYVGLLRYCDGKTNVQACNMGLFSRKETVSFCVSENFKEVSRIVFEGSPILGGVCNVAVNALDNMPEISPSFIKMDIEGSELEALKGAANTLRKNKPKLSICLYHKTSDFWDIPLFLKDVVPEYKFFVRHHIISPLVVDTILYAAV
jgi:FkbM family methyltransferase